jgi:hypothetical protein
MGNSYAAKFTFSETVKFIPNDKENAILCQTIVFLLIPKLSDLFNIQALAGGDKPRLYRRTLT